MRSYFFLTVLVSAFLLLMIQPMIAKILLPNVGGAPAVWITSMLFFQTVLLAGYAYAALTTRYLTPRFQWVLHLTLFAAAVVFTLPLAVTPSHIDVISRPDLWVLMTLLMTVGLPYFVLSASSSLLQHWYFSITQKQPYFLFSASNAGSLIGLIAYPFLIEWLLTLDNQLSLFTAGFCFLLALFSGMILGLKKLKPTLSQRLEGPLVFARSLAFQSIALAFIPSALFLALTLYITTDIGSLPFLWIIPLSLYLISFIIAFAQWGAPLIRMCQKVHVPAAVVILGLTVLPPSFFMLFFHCLAYFIIAVSCHGHLSAIKPEPSQVAKFFFFVSLGGALGGLLNVLAPFILNDTYEYEILAVLSILALPASRSWAETKIYIQQNKENLTKGAVFFGVLVSIIWISLLFKPERFGDVTYQTRNFYGVSKVRQTEVPDFGTVSGFIHGSTLHGIQSSKNEYRLNPSSYYVPIQDFISTLPNSYYAHPFASLGLGVGTVGCYGKAGQLFDFYEIDQAVIDIAQNPQYFTYLQDCPPDFRIIKGDGRIQLERADADLRYNLLIMDAFTSDAIPMHLVTKEAVENYIDHIQPKTGFIAFNVSNRYYNLAPFLARIAQELGWNSYGASYQSKDENNILTTSSEWVIVTPPDFAWEKQLLAAEFTKIEPNSDIPLWTDNYSHILPAMK